MNHPNQLTRFFSKKMKKNQSNFRRNDFLNMNISIFKTSPWERAETEWVWNVKCWQELEFWSLLTSLTERVRAGWDPVPSVMMGTLPAPRSFRQDHHNSRHDGRVPEVPPGDDGPRVSRSQVLRVCTLNSLPVTASLVPVSHQFTISTRRSSKCLLKFLLAARDTDDSLWRTGAPGERSSPLHSAHSWSPRSLNSIHRP